VFFVAPYLFGICLTNQPLEVPRAENLRHIRAV